MLYFIVCHMQCFNGQETVMDSLQNGIWKFWTGQQISDYCAINVWHAYKYLNIGQCRYTIDFWLVCLPQQCLTFDTAITILILYSQEILNPLWTNLQQIQDTHLHNLYFAAVREFVNNSRAKQETKYVELFC